MNPVKATLPPEVTASLQRGGLCPPRGSTVEPLSGGVSSDIHLVRRSDGTAFVVKRALTRLRVAATWEADPRRNAYEHRWFRRAGEIVPGYVPTVLHADDQIGCFAMEFIDGLHTWKHELLAGDARTAVAAIAGTTLGRLHAATWDSALDRAAFATGELFHALRLEPYLLATARAQPSVAAALESEAARLAGASIALVHGDYSPKNLLVGDSGRFVVVDAEVAWFGDPVFDVAFLANHLLLKALHHAPSATGRSCLALLPVFVGAYAAVLGARWTPEIDARAARLLAMLLLARVDGKSPVEYLDAGRRETVRRFTLQVIPAPPPGLLELGRAWERTLFPA